MAEAGARLQKHSEVRPQGGQVNNSKALQRVAGEPAVLESGARLGAIFFHMNAYNTYVARYS